jgi:hypothetical protein
MGKLRIAATDTQIGPIEVRFRPDHGHGGERVALEVNTPFTEGRRSLSPLCLGLSHNADKNSC